MRVLNRLGAEGTGRGHSRQVGCVCVWGGECRRLGAPGKGEVLSIHRHRCELKGTSDRGLRNYEDLDLLTQDRGQTLPRNVFHSRILQPQAQESDCKNS